MSVCATCWLFCSQPRPVCKAACPKATINLLIYGIQIHLPKGVSFPAVYNWLKFSNLSKLKVLFICGIWLQGMKGCLIWSSYVIFRIVGSNMYMSSFSHLPWLFIDCCCFQFQRFIGVPYTGYDVTLIDRVKQLLLLLTTTEKGFYLQKVHLLSLSQQWLPVCNRGIMYLEYELDIKSMLAPFEERLNQWTRQWKHFLIGVLNNDFFSFL